MQKERQVRVDGDVELGGEVGQLYVFGTEPEAVVVEPDFAKGDDGRGSVALAGEGAQGGEERGGAGCVVGDSLAGAGVHADGAIEEAGCGLMAVKL